MAKLIVTFDNLANVPKSQWAHGQKRGHLHKAYRNTQIQL
jgi:hypothetical protein